MESKPKLIVMPSERGGRGVFTTIALEKSSIIEVSPVIVIPPVDVPKIHETILHDFYFLWGDDEKSAAIALGFGSLFNHAIYPNLDYEMDFELNTISFVALQDIDPWTELTINYNGKSGDSQEVWFKIN
ncbi:MAG: SET domain-containing protein-lysine N-methyltransferase [Saprospiraceae bacterium]|mgnify:CR=1 FL=1|jgi:SET domain-containing protein|nr:SET domain-containing protein-lysine N-methyltransferase [Saprospiraceae bacterium]MBL0294777.1 SET domain-containing protein-lysine N-methyltransferase [Saprospiraceae bacterium]